MIIGSAHRATIDGMTEVAEDRAETVPVDFGQALGALLRTYLDGAREVVRELPGGPRGYQVMSVAAVSRCANQARMAETLGLDRTVMTYLVDDLEHAGLVERRPDPTDRRARQVFLTTQGQEVLTAAAQRIEAVEHAVLGGLSQEDAGTFRMLLMKVVAAGPVDPLSQPCDGSAPTTC